MKRFLLALLVALTAGMWLLAFVLPSAATKPDEDTGHKVTICHRTHSDTNPYVVITVDIAAAGYGGGKGDHYAEHKGPVWELGLKEQHVEWGDIIPPYTYEDFVFPGYNWSEAGQAIYEDGCKPGTQTSSTPPPTSPPPTSPPPCEDEGGCTTTPPPTSPPPTSPPPTYPPTTQPPTSPPTSTVVCASPPCRRTADTGLPGRGMVAAGAGLGLLIAGTVALRRSKRWV